LVDGPGGPGDRAEGGLPDLEVVGLVVEHLEDRLRRQAGAAERVERGDPLGLWTGPVFDIQAAGQPYSGAR